MTKIGRGKLVAALIIVVLGVGLAVNAASGGPAGALHIRFGAEPGRSPDRPLTGQSIVGLIYVFIGDDPSVRRVRYFLDDPQMLGRPLAVRTRSPFDLVGKTRSGHARAFDTKRLSHGKHTLIALVELETGVTRMLRSAFRVPRLFVSQAGSDSSMCTRIIPCQGFDRAYDLARVGQVIEVTSGEFPWQVIVGAKEAPGVVFDLQGAHVAGLEMRGTNAELRNGRIDSWGWDQSNSSLPQNVTFRNISTRSFYMDGGSNIKVLGGSLGPNGCAATGYANINWIISGGSSPIQNVVLDGVTIHDNVTCLPGEHYEAIRIDRNSRGVTIRNSRFERNEIFHIFITDSGFSEATVPRDITIENNTFDRPINGVYAIKTQEPSVQTCRNYTIRNNRFANAGAIALTCPTGLNVVLEGNTFG